MRSVALPLSLALVLISPSASLAAAVAIPGATYAGVASDDANVTFTVSPDGTVVDGYQISGATGNEAGGHICDFDAAGSPGVWEGAPIDGDAFEYTLGSSILFQGTFTGPQAASGSFRLYDAASGSSPACDTGTVTWTASTTATPPSGTTGPSGQPPAGKPKIPTYTTSVSIKKRSATRLGGSVRASGTVCVSDRVVDLMVGRRRIATTHTNARGSYALSVAARLHKQYVRAAVPARRNSHEICAAGSSRFVTVTT